MKQIVFIILLAATSPKAMIDTSYARILPMLPAGQSYQCAVAFYDRDYKNKWIAAQTNMKFAILIDLQKNVVTRSKK